MNVVEKWTREGGETDREKSPSFSGPKDKCLWSGAVVNEGRRGKSWGKAKGVTIRADKGLWN